MSSINPDPFDHPQRSIEEQTLHQQVIQLVEQKFADQGDVEVFTNHADDQRYPLLNHDDEPLFPDVFTKAGENITTLCAIETPSTVSDETLQKWKSYEQFDASFIVVVPEDCVELAQSLLNQNGITSEGIFSYQY